MGILAYRGADDYATLRTSTVERALAERPSGWALGALAQRLGPLFDVGDVLVVLRRRPDLFLKWEGRWLSRAASLDQSPRTLRWDFDKGHVPEEWHVFSNPRGAAKGWRAWCQGIQELAFNPQTSHLALTVGEGRHPELRLHVDHTVLLGRAAWVLWAVTDDRDVAATLNAEGFFLWRQSDVESMVDVTHRITLSTGTLTGPMLATWTLHTPLDLAQSLTHVLVRCLGILSPTAVDQRVESDHLPTSDMRAFDVARRLWARRQAGETIAHCLKCGNALSDPNSAALGYGPECAARLGLGVVRALARGKDGVLFMGAKPLAVVRDRMRAEVGI